MIYFVLWSLDCEQEYDVHLGRSREKWRWHEQREWELLDGQTDACLLLLKIATIAIVAQWRMGESLCNRLGAWVWRAFENALRIFVYWSLEDRVWWEMSLCSAMCGVGAEPPSGPATDWKRQGELRKAELSYADCHSLCWWPHSSTERFTFMNFQVRVASIG